jgi:hypothetical protein
VAKLVNRTPAAGPDVFTPDDSILAKQRGSPPPSRHPELGIAMEVPDEIDGIDDHRRSRR